MQPAQRIFSTPSCIGSSEQRDDSHQFFQQIYSPYFQPALDFLMRDVSAVAMLKSILSNDLHGEKISLMFGRIKTQASYNFATNSILFSESYRESSLQEQVAFLFFELQNVSQRQDFQRLHIEARTLGKERFVEQIEAHEYHSALATHHYMQKCVSAGFFTKEAPYFYTPLNFKDHYHFQQLTGHSQSIANYFDKLVSTREPYRGTWPRPLMQPQIPILKSLLINKTIVAIPQTTEKEKQEAEKEIKELMDEIDSLFTAEPTSIYDLWKNAHEIFHLPKENGFLSKL